MSLKWIGAILIVVTSTSIGLKMSLAYLRQALHDAIGIAMVAHLSGIERHRHLQIRRILAHCIFGIITPRNAASQEY